MTDRDIIKKVDHTALSTTLTWDELKIELDFAMNCNCACVAISPNYVKRAREYFNSNGSNMDISSCVAFPRGDSTTETKVFEIKDSIKNGATEIDAVVNQCEVKNKNWEYIRKEFEELKKACGHVPLKIIIETSELDEIEKVTLCKLITETNIDYVKTSTGFSKGGATIEDILLIKKCIGPKVKVKASGGIRDKEAALKMIEAGAVRLGTSSGVKIVS